MKFDVLARDATTEARTARLVTSHGVVETPAFIPVGTQATVKTLDPEELGSIGAEIILANTYHLYLRPGIEVIEEFGGVGPFMGWPGPLLTDSGGFQIFSLAHLARVDDQGVVFRSHLDGSEHRLSPQSAMEIQRVLGADIVMALDECIAADADRSHAAAAAERTRRWAAICRDAPLEEHQAAFGIVQGGAFEDLRRECAAQLVELDFPGYAIGGLSVGEEKQVTYELAALVCRELPSDRPRYLMGVGSPEDLVESIGVGVDMFDCVLPTRVARNGGLLTLDGRVNILNRRFRKDDAPIDPDCDCTTCRRFSAAYLHHLFRAKELLGLRLASVHNLRFMMRLTSAARDSIAEGEYAGFSRRFRDRYRSTDQEERRIQKARWREARSRNAR